mmetsp:Transcript_9444/g.14151  ORF Transcript_9444/g.14151 Transcript_9444/m.14151 type:complete len:1132 (-) Transcript_9444:64-3459(-)
MSSTMNANAFNQQNKNPFDDEVQYDDDSDDSLFTDDGDSSYCDGNNSNHDNNGTSGKGGHGNAKGKQAIAAAAPVESSWQFLGDLPYRRVSLYDDITWGPEVPTDGNTDNHHNHNKNSKNNGLTSLPPEAQTNIRIKSSHLSPHEYAQFLSSTTRTIVASCPNGGPIATITIPRSVGGGISGALSRTQIRIMTNAGQVLSTIDFPPDVVDSGQKNDTSASGNANANQKRQYSASDVLSMGFTSRCILVLILRDSYCLTFSLSGKPILPPFYILQQVGVSAGVSGMGGGELELLEATVYEGGVAVLSANMTCALMEILDGREDGDEDYRNSAFVATRIVRAYDYDDEADIGSAGSGGGGGEDGSSPGAGSANVFQRSDNGFHPILDSNTASYYALITPLPTSTHAKSNYISYTSIAVLPRVHTQSRHPDLFLGTSENSVIICDTSTSGGIIDVSCQERITAPIIQMKFAPNGRFLACFTKNSIMTVISTNFETKVLDFDTSDGSSDLPHNMEWCGEDSVVLHWKNLGVLMVGPYGDWLRFPYDGIQNLQLCAEIDCCRVITDHSVEILQRVPPATSAMLRIGSIEPSAMLLDASDAFQDGSPASDEAARAITKTGLLMEAIEVCIDAASKEFDIDMQKRLLRAASYGMHFGYKGGSKSGSIGGLADGMSDSNNGTRPSEMAMVFVETAKKIRVLNALRDPSVGVVLTRAQYDSIDATGVVARLISMKRPAMASSLCTYLQLDEAVRAYTRAARAAAFVATDMNNSDSETADAAIKILNTDIKTSSMNRGGYATVALAASKAGRQGVANLLLTLESSISDKVLALTAIGMHSDAAAVAARARDDDLIFHVLVEFEKVCIAKSADASNAQMAYLGTVVKKFPPEARHLLSKYFVSMHDIKHVVNLQTKAQNYAVAGSIVAERALNLPREQDRLSSLQEASRIFGRGKETIFQKACTDEYLELILEQERLRRAYGQDVTAKTSSVTDTIYNVLCYAAVKMREANKLLAECEKLAKKFKVPEKRLWHTKIRAFSVTEQWGNMRYLAESRAKPPISFKYFASAAIKRNREVSDILWYVGKVVDGEERYDLYCEGKLWKRAFGEAKRLDDVRRVMHIRSVCNVPEIQRMCDDYTAANS